MRHFGISLILLMMLLFSLSSISAQNDEQIALSELEGLPTTIALTARGDAYQRDAVLFYDWQSATLSLAFDSDGSDSHATWSPDGTKLAMQSRAFGDWEIVLLDVETLTATNLTQNPASDMYPNWTPDQQVVHFSDRSGQAALWLSDPVRALAEGITTNDSCNPDYHPNWSPNGQYLAYRADCAGNGDIWRLEFETDERINLTADSRFTERYPAWSPDGSQILFVSNRNGAEDIFVMDADGQNVRNLTQHPAEDKQASWSPDGRFIIFISDRAGNDDVWLMDADGGRPTLFISAENTDFDWPWWQPNIMEEDEMSAANADVTFVRATQTGANTWRFDVTVAHPDTGWEDYADGWDVVLPDGTVIKHDPDSPFTRLLLHPHETEQPFTRSQSGIVIPADVTSVTVRAHDIVDGFGGQEIVVDLTQSSGANFEVILQ